MLTTACKEVVRASSSTHPNQSTEDLPLLAQHLRGASRRFSHPVCSLESVGRPSREGHPYCCGDRHVLNGWSVQDTCLTPRISRGYDLAGLNCAVGQVLALVLKRTAHFGDEFGVGLEADGVLQVGLRSGSVAGVAV